MTIDRGSGGSGAGSIVQFGEIIPGTEQATAGTETNFTITPDARRVTLLWDGVSFNNQEVFSIRLGTSGGIETSGYTGRAFDSAGTSLGASANWPLCGPTSIADASTFYGSIVLTRVNSAHKWAMTSTLIVGNSAKLLMAGGTKTLSAELTTVQVWCGGTVEFDAGNLQVMTEF